MAQFHHGCSSPKTRAFPVAIKNRQSCAHFLQTPQKFPNQSEDYFLTNIFLLHWKQKNALHPSAASQAVFPTVVESVRRLPPLLLLFKYLSCFIICLCPLFLNLSQFCVRFIRGTPTNYSQVGGAAGAGQGGAAERRRRFAKAAGTHLAQEKSWGRVRM